MSEFEWRNQMRKLGGNVEPARDLWPDIQSRIESLPSRRRGWLPYFAIAATVLIACGAGMLAWQTQPAKTTQTTASTHGKPVINVVQSDDRAPHKALAAAKDELDDASENIQQALEQRPDAVFLVGLLNRTNGQRMRVLKQATAG